VLGASLTFFVCFTLRLVLCLPTNAHDAKLKLKNPMVQSMIRNDPRFANLPHVQRAMDEMVNNPQMMEQMQQVMSNPQYQQMMASPEFQQFMQQQSMLPFGTTPPTSTSLNNPTLPWGGTFPFSSTTNPNTASTTASTPAATNNSNSNRRQSEEELTEEEMIAEAIRRSLQDNNNNNGP
jgi:hypothetical protein